MGQVFNIIDSDDVRVWRYVKEYAAGMRQKGLMIPIPYIAGLGLANYDFHQSPHLRQDEEAPPCSRRALTNGSSSPSGSAPANFATSCNGRRRLPSNKASSGPIAALHRNPNDESAGDDLPKKPRPAQERSMNILES